ncbi:MAG: helix-turn-helix domain-containing protein [Rhizomicrobium sp.]
MAEEDEKLRADARANRDRILDVAREALAADPSASLNSIAKTARVGAGTLYRHFPTREALVLASIGRRSMRWSPSRPSCWPSTSHYGLSGFGATGLPNSGE